jgi:hypothetical protein
VAIVAIGLCSTDRSDVDVSANIRAAPVRVAATPGPTPRAATWTAASQPPPAAKAGGNVEDVFVLRKKTVTRRSIFIATDVRRRLLNGASAMTTVTPKNDAHDDENAADRVPDRDASEVLDPQKDDARHDHDSYDP